MSRERARQKEVLVWPGRCYVPFVILVVVRLLLRSGTKKETMAAIAKLFNPATYPAAFAYVKQRAHAYYHPLVRQNRYGFPPSPHVRGCYTMASKKTPKERWLFGVRCYACVLSRISRFLKIFNTHIFLALFSSRSLHSKPKQCSSVPLWHSMIAISAIMYSGTYYARVCKSTFGFRQELAFTVLRLRLWDNFVSFLFLLTFLVHSTLFF